jgi:hypothetical protein
LKSHKEKPLENKWLIDVTYLYKFFFGEEKNRTLRQFFKHIEDTLELSYIFPKLETLKTLQTFFSDKSSITWHSFFAFTSSLYVGSSRMSPTPASIPAATGCCSPKCQKQNASLLAALGGALSLACLISAVMTDMWTYTEEGIMAPGLSRAKKQNLEGSPPEHSSSAVTSRGQITFY